MGRLLDTNKESSKEIKPVASTGRLLNANQDKEVSSDVTPVVDKAVEKVVGKPDKNLFQRMKDGYMNVSNKAADIFEELPLGLYSGGASIPSGLLSSVQSLKSLTKNAAESKLKGGIGYKIASKLFPQIGEITDKGISAVDKVTGFQDTILNTAKEFTDTKLSKPAAVNVEKYHTKTGDISSKPERFIEGLGYTLASMAPAFATAGAGASPAASAFVGGLIEAGQNTDQLANEIDSRTDLTAQQKQNRKDTMFVSSLMASTIADRFGIFGDTKSLFRRLINTELTEIPEEVGTQFMQNLLSDKPLTEGLGQTALFTALMAPLLGGLGHSVQPTSEEEIITSLEKNPEFQSFDDTQKQQVVDTILNMQNTIVKDEDIADIASQFTEAYDQEFEQDKSLLKEEDKVDEALFQEKETTYKGEKDLTTKILKDLEGKTTVSKQYILDATNRGELKQVERDITREVLDTMKGDTINVKEFADKVKSELLPLTRKTSGSSIKPNRTVDDYKFTPRYENIALPDELRGKIKDYRENIYNSPIKTSAGKTHFGSNFRTDTADGYFGHTRIEDMADGDTRRVIEVQSDLYQKGGVEGAWGMNRSSIDFAKNESLVKNQVPSEYKNYVKAHDAFERAMTAKARNETSAEMVRIEKLAQEKGLSKLQQYNNPTAHFRMVREEIKKAAEDGITKLQFPTGETAMKIEGLVNRADKWVTLDNTVIKDGSEFKVGDLITYQTHEGTPHDYNRYLITENNGNGTFKAVDGLTAENDSGFYELLSKKDLLDDGRMPTLEELVDAGNMDTEIEKYLSKLSESLSAKDTVDTNNPIYKFYEKELSRYLKNNYQAVPVTDENGVTWYQVDVKPEYAEQPVVAFKEKTESTEVSYEKGIERLKEYEKQYGINFTKKVFDTIFTGRYNPDNSVGQAYGMYLGGRITLSELITETTADHEMIHLVVDNIQDIPTFKGFTKDEVLQLASNRWMKGKKVSEMTNRERREAEEYLAEGYEQFVKDAPAKKTFSKRLKDFFDNVIKTFKEFFGMSESDVRSIEQFYDRMYFGKAPRGQDIITIYDTKSSSNFMEARFDEFGRAKEIQVEPSFQEKVSETDKGLIEEAKKYKSAEEFVNNIGSLKTRYDWDYLDELKKKKSAGESYSHSDYGYLSELAKKYRGKEPSESFFRAGSISKDSMGDKLNDIYLTEDKYLADQYSNYGNTKVGEYKVLSRNPLDATNAKTLEKILGSDYGSLPNNQQLKQKLFKYAKDNGYDSVRFSDSGPDGYGTAGKSFVVFDKSIIKTKSQLTDIWKQANEPMFKESKENIEDYYNKYNSDIKNEQIQGRVNKLNDEIKSVEKGIVTIEKKIDDAIKNGLPTAKLNESLQALNKKFDLLDEEVATLLTIEDITQADITDKNITIKGNKVEQIAKVGEQMGKKLGIISEKQRQEIRNERIKQRMQEENRESQLKQLRENITRRLYTQTVLDVLRKNIPRSEWSRFMGRLTKVGVSEAKYSNLLGDIYSRSAELESEKGENFVKAKMRSRIGYLKKIFDVQPSLILNIKKHLKFTKSIKNLSLEELEVFIAELKKRIEFQQNNPVSYFDTNYLPKKKGWFASFFDKVKDTDKKLVSPIERSAKKISEPFYESLMSVFFEQERKSKTYSKETMPLMEIYEKATNSDKELIKRYAQSSQETQLRTVLEQYASQEEVTTALDKARVVLDEIHAELKSVGVDVPYRGFYFPRKIKKLDAKQAEMAIKMFEHKQGKIASAEEKQEILNALMRGIDVTRLPFVTLSGKRFETSRLVETIDADISELYEDFETALAGYIQGAINVIETRRYFGKTLIENPDYATMLDQSIGAKVYKMLEDGMIQEKDVTEMKWILNQVFVEKASDLFESIQKITNNFIYPLALGQITSTWNQVKDVAQTLLVNDIFAGRLNTIGKLNIKNEDVYLNDDWMTLEGSNQKDKTKIAQLLEKTLTPFGKADQFFLRVFINGAKRRLINLAKNDNQALQKHLIDIFGEEKGKDVMQEFKQSDSSSKTSDAMARVIFSEVGRVRPITKLQKTSGAIKVPVFYVLKNFAVKQLQFVRSEALDIIAKGIRTKDMKEVARGSGRLIAIMTVIGMLGAGVDELKDWVFGKNQDQSFWDRIVNNLLSITAFSKYNIEMIPQTGLATQVFNAYFLPAPVSIIRDIFDNAYKDMQNVVDGESIADIKTIRKFPLIGEIYYQKIGGGSKSEVESSIKKSLTTEQNKLEKIDKELVNKAEKTVKELAKDDFKNEKTALATMSKQDKDVYNAVKSVYNKEQLLRNASKLEKLVDDNAELGFGSPEEKEAIKDLTAQQLEYYKEIKKKKFPLVTGFTQAREKAKRNIVDMVVEYSKAYKTDVTNAFRAMFTKESLGDVEGNLTQLERMGSDVPAIVEQVSQEMKKEMMQKAGIAWADRGNYKLEHIVPVGAGGQSLTGDNLAIISNSEHNSYTPFDTKISKAVREGTMTRAEAEKISRQLKVAKTITVEEALNMIK